MAWLLDGHARSADDMPLTLGLSERKWDPARQFTMLSVVGRHPNIVERHQLLTSTGGLQPKARNLNPTSPAGLGLAAGNKWSYPSTSTVQHL